jgi:hypothetical protein
MDAQAADKNHEPEMIKVTVTFPLTNGRPYQADEAPETTGGRIIVAAMEHFNVTNDAEFTYKLTHDGKPVAESATVASIAGEAHAVAFRLVKEITQG